MPTTISAIPTSTRSAVTQTGAFRSAVMTSSHHAACRCSAPHTGERPHARVTVVHGGRGGLADRLTLQRRQAPRGLPGPQQRVVITLPGRIDAAGPGDVTADERGPDPSPRRRVVTRPAPGGVGAGALVERDDEQ